MRLLLCWGLILLTIHSFAQNKKSLKDTTLLLSEVRITPEIQRFVTGSKIQEVDSLALRHASPFLSDLLTAHTGIYLKEYGNGQLASITLRGTSSERTAVLWNGININSPSLGQTDFGTVPSVLIEGLGIQYGASCTKYGSDAIGGSVILQTSSDFVPHRTKLDFRQSHGSFGLVSTSLGVTYSGRHLQSQTKLYRFDLTNDFDYQYRGETLQNQNAQVHYHGLQQSFQYHQRRHSLILDYWMHHNDRGIQAIIGGESQDKLKDISSRLSLQYLHDWDASTLQISTGFVDDHQWYNNGEDASQMHIERYNTKAHWEVQPMHWLDFRIGGNAKLTKAYSNNYKDKTQEKRLALFALLSVRPLPFWTLDLKMRQVTLQGFDPPFTPSLGTEITALKSPNQSLQVKGMIAKSYRVPTFNERFWQPGGQPDIRPEHGMHYEAGLSHQLSHSPLALNTEITYFDMMIDQWILWTSTGTFWSPKNLRRVHSKGIELSTKASYKISNNISLSSDIQYTWLKTTNLLAIDQDDQTVGNQLPYTPQNRVAINTRISIHGFWTALQYQYTGLRYENFDNKEDLLNAIPAYEIAHLSIGKTLWLHSQSIDLAFQIKNISNKKYQNYLNRAMPLRSYVFSLRTSLSKHRATH